MREQAQSAGQHRDGHPSRDTLPRGNRIEQPQRCDHPERQQRGRQPVGEQRPGLQHLIRMAGRDHRQQRHQHRHRTGERTPRRTAVHPPRPISDEHLHARRPDQTGTHQPHHVERRIDAHVQPQQLAGLHQPRRQQVEQGRVIRVIRPEVGGRADPLVQNLADEIVMRRGVDLMQRIVPHRLPAREPQQHHRERGQHAQHGADRQQQSTGHHPFRHSPHRNRRHRGCLRGNRPYNGSHDACRCFAAARLAAAVLHLVRRHIRHGFDSRHPSFFMHPAIVSPHTELSRPAATVSSPLQSRGFQRAFRLPQAV